MLGRYGNKRRAIDELRNAGGRYAEGGRGAGAAEKQIESLRRQSAATAGYLEGQNETMIAATLQDRLKAAVMQAGGQLKSTQGLPDAENAKSRRIAWRANTAL